MVCIDPAAAVVRRAFAIVPVKPLDEGKSRLATVLDTGQRRRLNELLLQRSFERLAEFPGPARTIVVSRSSSVLAEAQRRLMIPVLENGNTLNEALVAATKVANDRGATSVLIVPTDLPFAEPGALARVAAVSEADRTCVLVPDRHRRGTNVLLLTPPREDIFSFGEDSFLKHQAVAKRHGLEVRIVEDKSLAFDIDLPDDYREWSATNTLVPGASGQS